MNLQKLNDISYLKFLAENKDELNKEIRESKGYVLNVMNRNKIFPSLDFLMEDVSSYSLLSIIKNYNLSRKQLKEVRGYFNNYSQNVITNDILSKDEVLTCLKDGTILPLNTKLDLETIKNNYLELSEQYIKDDYTIKKVMTNSLIGISEEDFFSLDESFLRNNCYLFNINPNLFESRAYGEKYKKYILEENEKNGRYTNIESFRNYIFKNDDKAFLEELLAIKKSLYRSANYNNYLRFKGFKDLISKEDYFKKYNSSDLTNFSEKEIKENLRSFQNILLKNIKKEEGEPFKVIACYDMDINQQYLLIDNYFIDELINKLKKIKFGYLDVNSFEINKKFDQLKFKYLNYVINNQTEKVLSVTSLTDLASGINYFYEKNYLNQNTELSNLANIFYNSLFIQFLKTDNFIEINQSGNFINRYSVDLISKIAEEKPSINFLIFLIKNNEKNNNYHIKSLKSIIDNMIPKLDKKSVLEVTSFFNYKFSKNKINETNSIASYEDNLLNYKDVSFKDLSELSLSILLKESQDFRNAIINKKEVLKSRQVYSLISIAGADKKIMDFLVEYLKINENNVKEDESLLRFITTHPLAKKLMKLESKDYEEKDYKEFLIKVKDLNLLKEEEEEGEKSKNDKDYYDSPEYDTYSLKSRVLDKEIESLKKGLTFDFLKEKINSLLKGNNFEEYYILKNNSLVSGNNSDIIFKYIDKLSFNKLLINIEDPSFIKVLEDSFDYNNVTKIKFKEFKSEENNVLAELLCSKFKNDIKPLSFFKPEAKGFMNEFVVKNMPLEVFYSYSLRPEIEGNNRMWLSKQESLINNPYTNEQLIESFNKANKIGFFSLREANIAYHDVFQSNFKGREESFKEILSITKENNHKMYAILAHRSIINNFYDRDSKMGQEEFQSHYFKNNFDIDTVLKGLKIIINEINEAKDLDYSKFNNELAFSVLDNIIYMTQYDKRDSGDLEYFSFLDVEERHKIIDFLFKEVPYFTMEHHRVGGIFIPSYIAENFKNYAEIPSIINDILIPKSHMKGPNLSLSERGNNSSNRYNNYVDEITMGMVNFFIKQNKLEYINYISYLIESSNFNEELSYDFKCESGFRDNTQILDFISTNPVLIEKLKICQDKFSLDSLLAEKTENKLQTRKHKI